MDEACTKIKPVHDPHLTHTHENKEPEMIYNVSDI